MNLEHQPSNRTERILMWSMRGPQGLLVFGALEDGTAFQRLPGQEWSTLIAGPVSDEEATGFILAVTAAAERQGAVLEVKPCEFGIDERVVREIRSNENWRGNGPQIMIAFDMARRVRL